MCIPRIPCRMHPTATSNTFVSMLTFGLLLREFYEYLSSNPRTKIIAALGLRAEKLFQERTTKLSVFRKKALGDGEITPPFSSAFTSNK